MRCDPIQAVLAAWAAKDLPARLDVTETAKLLGFAEHDIQILMGCGKLSPLGDPAPNAPKWFAAIEVIRLAADHEWLNRATKEVSKHWRQKRERQRKPKACLHSGKGGSALELREKSSPKSSPNERWKGDEGAMTSDERTIENSA